MKAIIRKILSPHPEFLSSDTSILLFRVLVSLSMINTHGLKKILNFPETVSHIPDPFGMGGYVSTIIAIIANIVGPIFIIFGLGTRVAILPILGVTLMGFFVVHGSDPWAVRDIPLMYSLAYLLIFFLGAGKYSLDFKFFKNS
ncbi:DoxX family protein [Kordia jejudonensis]|uniref:DoxX family protein n=1 Tax=Kordia jejudonensis TaxID=1348245 RepID=UPI0006299C2B|nr:DoxX family protein [Kordia jejudonensis]